MVVAYEIVKKNLVVAGLILLYKYNMKQINKSPATGNNYSGSYDLTQEGYGDPMYWPESSTFLLMRQLSR